MLSDVAGQRREITPATAIQMQNALVQQFGSMYPPPRHGEPSVWSTFDVPLRNMPAKANELLACRVEVDPSTWVCPVTKVRLRPKSLGAEKRKQMHGNLMAMVREQSTLVEHLQSFSKWLR